MFTFQEQQLVSGLNLLFFSLSTRNTTLENPVFQDVPGKADERTS